MENVTDRTSNPFDMRPPCETPCSTGTSAVFGYGDANGDFQVIGDHPGVHGGETTGIPFTDAAAGEAIQELLYETGFTEEPYSDDPTLENCFLSYIHMCCVSEGDPGEESYARLERFFDAELRAINAHILLPVGARATGHVLETYTSQAHRIDLDMDALHAQDIRGRGVLVVPIKDPVEWEPGDRETITGVVESILDSDYRQTKGVATTVG